MIETEFLTDTVREWFYNLDYEYMVLHLLICYGLYYSSNMRWIVEWFSPVHKKGRSKAIWLVGGVLAVLEIVRFVPFVTETELAIQKIVSITHSYVVIQVFVDPIVITMNKWLNIVRKSANDELNKK